ncbi:hypothetical protein GA0070622_2775 [Micromonospora sediminicola]|uniref:Uncharacterized protein n=1 Tax=Micromonospora sediminicola TaxID=946078 RepID=A0A1A9B9E9_9ACTN|nr:hypothetical protein [Micromonospora sediminicola]SBT65768.1 hypothetical protein GA0070622_2775 [Micromonospora sediminicola]
MTRTPLWLFLSAADDPAAPYVGATLGRLARESGALFEAYLESRREGSLFARTGSTVLGGGHHTQFNQLCAQHDVTVFTLGHSAVFDSSVRAFGLTVGARAHDPGELYAQAYAHLRRSEPATVFVGPVGDLAPYLVPEVAGRDVLGFPVGADLPAGRSVLAAYADVPGAAVVDTWHDGDDLGSVTLRIADRHRATAQGVCFGDPVAVLAQLPRLVRERRVAVFAPARPLPPAEVRFSPYTEETSAIAEQTATLALDVGDPVLIGRQTGDGDLFAWSRHGVCMQITEPNRPAFPVLADTPQPWSPAPACDEGEYTDDELRDLAAQGAVLTAMMWHSGEIAHNESMLNLLDLAGATGLKMGVGVHAARYRTAPQTWELLAAGVDRGGVRGLVEPVLHSGGRGVLAEFDCPPEALAEHCAAALDEIRSIAGPGQTPSGYYAFCDTDLDTFAPASDAVYAAIESAGLSYVVSSARPGRNRVVRRTDGCVVVNQSARSVAHASPFVRITTAEELREDVAPMRPGWVLATLDAPVIAFAPYIWRHGGRFMRVVDWFTSTGEAGERRNVLPSTVARYARILADGGFLP